MKGEECRCEQIVSVFSLQRVLWGRMALWKGREKKTPRVVFVSLKRSWGHLARRKLKPLATSKWEKTLGSLHFVFPASELWTLSFQVNHDQKCHLMPLNANTAFESTEQAWPLIWYADESKWCLWYINNVVFGKMVFISLELKSVCCLMQLICFLSLSQFTSCDIVKWN